MVSANAAFLNMTGYTQPELMGVDCSVFNGPLTDCTVATMLVEATRQQKGFSAEILNYRKDGSTFWNELTLSPVPDHLGQLTHFISVNTDISARKRLDQIVHEKNVELQRAMNFAPRSMRSWALPSCWKWGPRCPRLHSKARSKKFCAAGGICCHSSTRSSIRR